jgi:SH3 domain protein
MTFVRAASLCIGILLSPLLRAETAWISDEFTVPLRSGPSDGHRIVHRGLPTGTELDVLQTDGSAGYTQVRTQSGIEGWINTQYLARQPIARSQLVTANNRIAALQGQLAQRGETLTELRSSSTEASTVRDQLATQVTQLEGELADLKAVSSGAIEEHARNQELVALNTRLRAEVDDLIEESQRLEQGSEQRWLLIGGGLVFGGLIAGFALKARPRRSGWS